MRFNPGDKVVCVDSSYSNSLKEGGVYTVDHVYKRDYTDFAKLKELSGGFFPSRFRLVTASPQMSIEDML